MSTEPLLVELLNKPWLRGRIQHVPLLKTAMRILRSDKVELTEENAPRFFEVLQTGLHGETSYLGVHNALYKQGFLQPARPHLPSDDFTLGEPINEFAKMHRELMVEMRQKSMLKSLNETKQQISLREAEKQQLAIDAVPLWETYVWSNKLAKAIEDRNLNYLLEIFDQPGNETSKKAVEKHFGIKLNRLTAAQRRKAVFVLAGFDGDEAVATAELEYDRAERAKLQARASEKEEARKKAIVEAATANMVLYQGATLSVKQFVDDLIAAGYCKLEWKKRGAVSCPRLVHESNHFFYPLRKKGGLQAYALLKLAAS